MVLARRLDGAVFCAIHQPHINCVKSADNAPSEAECLHYSTTILINYVMPTISK